MIFQMGRDIFHLVTWSKIFKLGEFYHFFFINDLLQLSNRFSLMSLV